MRRIATLVFLTSLAVLAPACGKNKKPKLSAEAPARVTTLGINAYLWRATLDTLAPLPLVSADAIGGLVIYDWKSFEGAPAERIKATVFILDSRLRADGVKVSVYRQVNTEGTWTDAGVDSETGQQLENKILERARLLKASEIG